MDTKETKVDGQKEQVVADETSALEKELNDSYSEQVDDDKTVEPAADAQTDDVTQQAADDDSAMDEQQEEQAAETVKVKPETVPLATFLETKKRLKELERREAERLSTVQTENEAKVDAEPTSVADLIRLGLIERGGLVTSEQLEQLEINREKKQQREQRNQSQTMTRQAENQFRASLSPDVEIAGLGVDDVINELSVMNLTLKDQTDINNTPFMQRPKLIYDRCIARDPNLKAKYEKFLSIQRKKVNKKTMDSAPFPKRSAPSKAATVRDSEKSEAELMQEIEDTY